MYKEATVTGGTGGDGEHYSRLVRELCALLVTIISPSAAGGGNTTTTTTTRQPRGIAGAANTAASPGVSPAAAASMLLGASMALMLCGSVTFAIGLLLMPWVAGIALLFGFAGAVSTVSSGVFGIKDATRGPVPSSPASPVNSDKPVAA